MHWLLNAIGGGLLERSSIVCEDANVAELGERGVTLFREKCILGRFLPLVSNMLFKPGTGRYIHANVHPHTYVHSHTCMPIVYTYIHIYTYTYPFT